MKPGDVVYYKRRKAVVVEVNNGDVVIQMHGNVKTMPRSDLRTTRN